jgi:threonylcarbamoyladenosine tRNA methylthiotransferase MtaB
VARGPSRSLPIPMLKAQLTDLIHHGHHEIVLTGINIGQYEDPETRQDLAALLQKLITIPGEFRLRLSSLDPAEVTPQLLDVMANTDKICDYLHLSMQSAEDHVLKRMARRHREQDLYAVCDAIQQKMPGAAIGADIIVGFPEETPERFTRTYQVLSDLPMSYFHVFTYSKREGTPAADFPDQVPEPEKKERTHQLIALSDQKNLNYRQRLLNQQVHVIVEEKQDRGMSEQFIHIGLDRTDLPQNTLVPVTITEVTPTETRGEVCV